jgi:hypothetical protein
VWISSTSFDKSHLDDRDNVRTFLTYVTEYIIDTSFVPGVLVMLANEHIKLLFHAPGEMVLPVASKGLINVCSAFVNILCKVSQGPRRDTVARIVVLLDVCQNVRLFRIQGQEPGSEKCGTDANQKAHGSWHGTWPWYFEWLADWQRKEAGKMNEALSLVCSGILKGWSFLCLSAFRGHSGNPCDFS